MDIVVLVDSVASRMASLLLLVVILKFATKRLHSKRADMCLMKIHKPASYGLILAGVVHMFTSFYDFSRAGILPYVAGLISLLAMIGAVYVFKRRKTCAKWLLYHRILTVIAVTAFLIHPRL